MYFSILGKSKYLYLPYGDDQGRPPILEDTLSILSIRYSIHKVQ